MAKSPRTVRTNVNELTFGVEIECALPVEVINRLGIRIGGYHAGIIQSHLSHLPIADWKFERDGSLRRFHYTHTPVEIVSPKLSGREGIDNVLAVLAWIKSVGGRVNSTCGLHVTVGLPDNSDATLNNIALLGSQCAEALVAVGASLSRRTGIYSRSLRVAFAGAPASTRQGIIEAVSRNRYQAVNFTHAKSHNPRVEFRAFAGTLNPNRMLGAIWFSLGIVERALNIRPLKAWAVRKEAGRSTFSQHAHNALVWFLCWPVNADRQNGDFERPLGIITPSNDSDRVAKVIRQIKADAARLDEVSGRAEQAKLRRQEAIRRARQTRQARAARNEGGQS